MKRYSLFIVLFLFAVALFWSCGSASTDVESNYGPEQAIKRYADDTTLVMMGVRYAKADTADQIQSYYYRNGQVYISGRMLNNKREGEWAAFDENGQPLSKAHYENGLEHGQKTVYFPNGKIRYQGQMEKGEKLGKWQFYDKEGKLVKELTFNPIEE